MGLLTKKIICLMGLLTKKIICLMGLLAKKIICLMGLLTKEYALWAYLQIINILLSHEPMCVTE